MALFVLALKWRKLTRVNMFLDISIFWLQSYLPIDMPIMQYHAFFQYLNLIMSFTLNYFYWWPTLIYSALAIALWHYNRSLLYEEPLAETMGKAVETTIWFAINVFMIHLVITWVGKLFAESQVLRSDNENILDNLEEGVVIIDDSDKNGILYYNLSATGCKRNQQ